MSLTERDYFSKDIYLAIRLLNVAIFSTKYISLQRRVTTFVVENDFIRCLRTAKENETLQTLGMEWNERTACS